MRSHLLAGLIAFIGGVGVHAAGLVVAAVQPSAVVTALLSDDRPTDTDPLKPTIVTANTFLTSTVSDTNGGSTLTIPWPISPIPSSSVSVNTSPPASATPLSCPRDNNTWWTDHASHQVYQLQCGIDYYDPAANWNIDEGMRHSWEECAKWCGEVNSCQAFSYIAGIPLRPNCWLKSTLNGQTFNWNSWAGKVVAIDGSDLARYGDGGKIVTANTVASPLKETTTVQAVKIGTTTTFVEDTAVTTAITTVVTTELVKPMAPATTLQVVPTSAALSTPIALEVGCSHEDWWADERAAWRAIEYFCQGGHDGTFGGQASDKILHGEDSVAAAYWPYNGTAVITSVASKAGCTVKLDKNLCMQRFRSPMYGCDLDVKYQKRGGSVSDGCFEWSIHMQSWPSVGMCHDQDTQGMGLCAVWSTIYPSGSTARDGLKIDWFLRD